MREPSISLFQNLIVIGANSLKQTLFQKVERCMKKGKRTKRYLLMKSNNIHIMKKCQHIKHCIYFDISNGIDNYCGCIKRYLHKEEAENPSKSRQIKINSQYGKSIYMHAKREPCRNAQGHNHPSKF